jgi:sulfur carrier protein
MRLHRGRLQGKQNMRVTINGQKREVQAETIDRLLQEVGLLSTQVAIEHNGTVLFRHEFPKTSLKSGDKIEIIRVVAGG